MHLLGFPGCCTAKVLTGFGGTDTAEYGYRPGQDYTDESMFNEVLQHLENAHRMGMAMVFATTNSQQEMANRVLPRAGFIKIEESAKPNHAEYTLLGWAFRLNLADAVRPLKVPANPFAKKKQEAPVRGLVFDDEPANPFDEWAEHMARAAVAPRHIPRENLRVNPVGEVPILPPIRGARAGMVVEDDLVPNEAAYGELNHPLRPGQVWDAFEPINPNRWDKMFFDANTGERIPDDELVLYRRGRVNGKVWYEIHPNFQGNMDVFPILRKDQRIKVRLFGENRAQPTGAPVGDWEWDTRFGDRSEIGAGTITHFKID